MSKFIGSNTLKFGGMYRRLGERASNPDEPDLPGRSSTSPCSVAALASSGTRCVPAAMGRRNSPEILDRKGGESSCRRTMRISSEKLHVPCISRTGPLEQ